MTGDESGGKESRSTFIGAEETNDESQPASACGYLVAVLVTIISAKNISERMTGTRWLLSSMFDEFFIFVFDKRDASKKDRQDLLTVYQ